MPRPASRARASLEKSFSAQSLGNWEIPSAWGAPQRHGPASVTSDVRSSRSRASSRASRRSSAGGRPRSSGSVIRPVTNASGHLLPHLKKPHSSFVPSQETLYMNWREKEALRVTEKKHLRKLVRQSMSTQDLAREMGAAAARSSTYGRKNTNRTRPATPDNIFGDSAIVGDSYSTRPSTGPSPLDHPDTPAKMSMGEAEDVVSTQAICRGL